MRCLLFGPMTLFCYNMIYSSGVVRSLELKDGDENSCSDTESIDDRASIASSVPGTVEGDTTSIINNVPASTVADHVIEKLVIENNIFLKAALQLLDQRDRSIDQNSKTGKSNDGSSADVIMCGTIICQYINIPSTFCHFHINKPINYSIFSHASHSILCLQGNSRKPARGLSHEFGRTNLLNSDTVCYATRTLQHGAKRQTRKLSN